MKKLGLLGRKKGMTQIFGKDGAVIPVTVVQCGPCTVIEKRNKEKNGYEAVQLGFETVKKKERLSKPVQKYFEKKNLGIFATLKEFRTASQNFEVGQVIGANLFQVGDLVDVQGVTKGRGFQGVIKRHGKHGGPDAHGSDFHRRPGSIGMRTWPGRVFKNTRLPGRMGNDNVTIKNLTVVDVKPDQGLVLIEGGIPGTRNGLVVIYKRDKYVGTNGTQQRE